MSHYNKEYFNWQKQGAVVGGYLNKFKFEEHINSNDTVLDFGCGGGYLLNNFKNIIRKGFEINEYTWEECKKNGVEVTKNYDSIENDSIDVIISNHAMEHVPNPFEVLQELYKKLKKDGKLVIVIPCEQPNEQGFFYKPNDINQHLYTWCPMTFGNLVNLAGFKVLSCQPFQHQWCPDFKENYNKPDFHKRCREYAKKNNNIQIKLVATK